MRRGRLEFDSKVPKQVIGARLGYHLNIVWWGARIFNAQWG